MSSDPTLNGDMSCDDDGIWQLVWVYGSGEGVMRIRGILPNKNNDNKDNLEKLQGYCQDRQAVYPSHSWFL